MVDKQNEKILHLVRWFPDLQVEPAKVEHARQGIKKMDHEEVVKVDDVELQEESVPNSRQEFERWFESVQALDFDPPILVKCMHFLGASMLGNIPTHLFSLSEETELCEVIRNGTELRQ